MFYVLVDKDKRFKCWKGEFYYTPLPDDSNILKFRTELELMFYFKKGQDYLLIYNDDGTLLSDSDFLSQTA